MIFHNLIVPRISRLKLHFQSLTSKHIHQVHLVMTILTMLQDEQTKKRVEFNNSSWEQGQQPRGRQGGSYYQG